MAEAFHRGGHHIQKAHGRRGQFAADGEHLQGGMIALMPASADARRLAFPGGEKAAELHCTLLFLGDDGSVWEEEQRSALENIVRELAAGVPPVQADIFGVAHWNGGSDSESWVWSVGDSRDQGLADSTLQEARMIVSGALAAVPEAPEIPQQHSPWVAHICAAYTGDLTVVRALEKRLGPVTFDRIRLSFGDDDRDIPLAGTAVSLTAAGQRDPHEHEAYTDFAGHTREWTDAVGRAAGRLSAELDDWRQQIRAQIMAGADTPEELAGLTVEATEAADILSSVMHGLALKAGDALVKEARWQGVEIPEWSLPDDAVTAAVGGRRLLRSVAQMTSDLLATNMVQSARRFITGMLGRSSTPEALAAAVDERLQEGQEQALKGPIGTAMSAAQTAGREAVLKAAPPGDYYASEILDKNTCGPCKAVDGEQFADLEIAVKAYPVMGYKDCVGPRYGNACRGMIVARWAPEETEPVAAAGEAEPFHGTPGRPSYRRLHPQGTDPRKGRKTQHSGGGWLGSSRFTEREHEKALNGYTSSGYKDINTCLRKSCTGSESEIAEKRARISALMDLTNIQDPTDRDITVHRGMRGIRLDLAEGDEFHDPGFASTSREAGFARDWISGWGSVVHIKVPAGSQVLDVASLGGPRSEGEVVLPPGSKFRVIKAEVPDDPMQAAVIHVELING